MARPIISGRQRQQQQHFGHTQVRTIDVQTCSCLYTWLSSVRACVCVLADSEAWQRNRNGINEPYQQCDVDAAAVHAHLLASLHPATCSAPYPMATPAQHIVCVCGSGGGAHRCKTDKTASRLPALGIPNLTHVAHCNCKCLSFRHAAPN